MKTSRSLPRLAVVILAVVMLTLSACTSSDSEYFQFTGSTKVGTVIPEKDRKPAQSFSAELLNGTGKAGLKDLKGKVGVVAYFASWCGPCKVEMPMLNGLHEELTAKDPVAFLGIDTRDERSEARSFVANNRITFPIAFDKPGTTALKLGNPPSGLPFTIVIDKKGRVAAVYAERYAAKDLERTLSTLKSER